MRLSCLSLAGFIALTMAHSLPKDDNYRDESRRTKRGWVKESAEIIGKAGKYLARTKDVFKAKRVILRDATPISARRNRFVRGNFMYTKTGGMERAGMDFHLTFPTNIRMIKDSKIGDIGIYEVRLISRGLEDLSNKFNVKNVKCAIQLGSLDRSGHPKGVPITVLYLE